MISCSCGLLQSQLKSGVVRMEAENRTTDQGPAEADLPTDAVRAPRHGLNAKALLMQAAAIAAEEAANIEEDAPPTLSADEQQRARLKSTFTSSSKLLSGIPKPETPIVAFVNQSKIPRTTRQQVLQKLAGQHLAMALLDADKGLTPETVMACEDIRKAALSAAIQQELKLFKSCLSKASYLNAAARTDASLVKFPPIMQTPPAEPVTSKLAASVQPLPGTELNNAANSEPDCHHRKRGSQGVDEASESNDAPLKKQMKVEQASAAATSTALLDDDIDWTATTVTPELQLAPASDFDQEADTNQVVAADSDADETHLKQADVKSILAEEQSQPQASNAAEVPPDDGKDAGHKEVHQAVAGYVKALLDPFYKAGIVDREMYKLVTKQAVGKIVQSHAHAEDADFLIHESEQIQKLVREYIRYAQKKCHKYSSL